MSFLGGTRSNVTELRHHAVLNEVNAYWEALRSGGTVPYRSEIDPRGIQRALKHSFILERMAPGMARIRVAGHVLTDLMGMEMRGMPVTALVAPESREAFRRALEDVFAGPATASLRLRGEGGFGKPGMEAQMILLPLRSDTGDVTRILGALVLEGRVGRTPRRFHLDGSFLRELDSGKERRRITPQAPEARPVADLLARTRPTPYAHLRVVKTDG